MDKRIWIAALALAVVAAGAWYVMRPRAEAPPPPAPPPQAEARPPDAPLPPAQDSDSRIRSALASASTKNELREWLSTEPDLLDRWAVIADNLAEDASPRKQLQRLAPRGPFKVVETKSGARIDPRGYERYNSFAEVVASVDAHAFAAVVREMHPMLESAYHKLGYPDRSFDSVATRALQRLAGAPVVEGPVELKPKGALWQFADEKLESQGPVEKHLLRMGPRNTKLIQAKAREIAQVLDLRIAGH
jgi:hypothetical protein